MSGWTESRTFQVGDVVATDFVRPWLSIWLDRLTTLRWRVPMTERRYFRCTTLAAGGMWPEIDRPA